MAKRKALQSGMRKPALPAAARGGGKDRGDVGGGAGGGGVAGVAASTPRVSQPNKKPAFPPNRARPPPVSFTPATEAEAVNEEMAQFDARLREQVPQASSPVAGSAQQVRYWHVYMYTSPTCMHACIYTYMYACVYTYKIDPRLTRYICIHMYV